MLLDDEDRRALLNAVADVARSEICPLTEQPEVVAGRTRVDAALASLGEIGVLSEDGDPGLGVWDAIDRPESCLLSVDVLDLIAACSPGVAYEVHLRGLAAALDRLAGGRRSGSTLTLEAASGEAGRATGAVLAGAPDARDRVVVADVWGATPRLHVGPPEWRSLWWPDWTAAGGWRLRRTPRAELAVAEQPHAHGLDELAFQRCTPPPAAVPEAAEAIADPEVVVDVLAAHSLGLLAVSVATARRSVDRARAFSTTRFQGGDLIGRHDAVAQLLARAEIAVTASAGLLHRAAGLSPGLRRLREIWQVRATCQPLLSAGGSDALQVFGGVGYMRDVGAERDQRDLNALRRLGGSPTTLVLRCAALGDTMARAS